MTLKELNEWIDSAKLVTYQNEFTDSCGNYEYTKIFEKNGKFYCIEYQNDYPHSKYVRGKGWIHGEYEVKEVVKESWMEYCSHYRIL